MNIRHAAPGDIAAVSDLHLLVFPEYFLSHLGHRFLRSFYAFFLEKENSHCLLADHEGQIVGFVAGTADTRQHFNAFYRRRFVLIASITGLRLLQDATIQREIGRRVGHVRLAMIALVRRDSPPSVSQEEDTGTLAQLLSIAVHPDHRRQGIAGLLADAFVSELHKVGARRVGASTLPGNARSIAFFQKNGWIIEHTTPESVYFQRDILEYSPRNPMQAKMCDAMKQS